MKQVHIKKIRKGFIKKLIFVITACFLVTLFCGFTILEESYKISDSGHGTSHHSSSSSHSSSSRSSSRRSSSSSSRSSSSRSSSGSSIGSGMPAAIVMSIFISVTTMIIVIAIIASIANKNPIRYMPNIVNDDDVVNKIKKYIPNFQKQEFLKNGYQIYVDVQYAWMNFKLEDVKNVITDEMYNMYDAQLEIMKAKGEQNIMSDFEELNAYIKDVEVQNNTISVTAVYVIEFYDYIIDQQKGKVVSGTSNQKMRVTYEMTYRKSLKGEKVELCPNCCGEIDNANVTATCKYCGSKLVFDNSNWVLTNKKVINQI